MSRCRRERAGRFPSSRGVGGLEPSVRSTPSQVPFVAVSWSRTAITASLGATVGRSSAIVTSREWMTAWLSAPAAPPTGGCHACSLGDRSWSRRSTSGSDRVRHPACGARTRSGPPGQRPPAARPRTCRVAARGTVAGRRGSRAETGRNFRNPQAVRRPTFSGSMSTYRRLPNPTDPTPLRSVKRPAGPANPGMISEMFPEVVDSATRWDPY